MVRLCRRYDLTMAAQLRYGEIPDVERQIKEREDKLAKTGLLRDEITPDDIIDVVAAWTGIPIRKLVRAWERIMEWSTYFGGTKST